MSVDRCTRISLLFDLRTSMKMPDFGSRTSIMTVVRKSSCLSFFVVVDGVEKWAGEEGAQTLASGGRASRDTFQNSSRPSS